MKGLKALITLILLVGIGFGIYYLATHKINMPEMKLAYAAEESTNNINIDNYTNVLDDLQKDENFNEEDYPYIENDYSMQVLQIAESADNELFVYVYQPCQNKIFKASSINISTAINENLAYKNYKLTLLNSHRSLFKYMVNDFEVKEDALRYYDISSIFRPFDKTVDEENEDNQITEVAYAVGNLWTACTVNGQKSYSNTSTETITITDKYVSYIRYNGGDPVLMVNAADGHFIAFSTDKQIDKLLEAEIYYTTRDYEQKEYLIGSNSKTYKNEKDEYKTMTYTDKVEDPSDGFLNKVHYTWDRIESVADFIAKEELTSEAKANIENKQWILRFLETTYRQQTMPSAIYTEGTEVKEVTILRLKFETDGVVYNLGTVDNKQNSSDNPANIEIKKWTELFQKILKYLPIVLLAILGIAIAPTILSVLIQLIGLLFQGVYYILTLPFQIFKKKNKGDK